MASVKDRSPTAIIGPLGCWQDLYDLPGFQEQLPADIIKSGFPVKRYAMPTKGGKRPCGISECRTPHLHGHVIQVGNRLSNVGHCCAAKYFGQQEWKSHLRQLQKLENERAAEDALRQAKAAALAKALEADVVPEDYQRVVTWLEAFDALPLRLRGDLGERAFRNQPEIIQQREPTEADIKRAKFHGMPRPQAQEVHIGTLLGVRAVNPNSRADAVSRRIAHQKEQLRTLAGDPGASTAQLLDATTKLDKSLQQLGIAIMRAREFFSEQNQQEIDKLPQGSAFRTILIEHMGKRYQGAA